eukprot:4708641-Amphidinium_carterae.2
MHTVHFEAGTGGVIAKCSSRQALLNFVIQAVSALHSDGIRIFCTSGKQPDSLHSHGMKLLLTVRIGLSGL